jgi:hypothetical protein
MSPKVISFLSNLVAPLRFYYNTSSYYSPLVYRIISRTIYGAHTVVNQGRRRAQTHYHWILESPAAPVARYYVRPMFRSSNLRGKGLGPTILPRYLSNSSNLLRLYLYHIFPIMFESEDNSSILWQSLGVD